MHVFKGVRLERERSLSLTGEHPFYVNTNAFKIYVVLPVHALDLYSDTQVFSQQQEKVLDTWVKW